MPAASHTGQVVDQGGVCGVKRPGALATVPGGALDAPPSRQRLCGLEDVRAEVFRVGEGVSGLAVGTKVGALLPDGGYRICRNGPPPIVARARA